MKRFYKRDKTENIITAQKNIASGHKKCEVDTLPDNAMIFCMSKWDVILETKYTRKTLATTLPRFLGYTPVYVTQQHPDWCFVHGGAGAPQIADTVETLVAMGVKNLVLVGLAGGFGDDINVGDIVVPTKMLIMEGTSEHYCGKKKFAYQNSPYNIDNVEKYLANKDIKLHRNGVVTTDACYRQSLYKEDLWRKSGCVCVEMESSAFCNVSKCYNIPCSVFLYISDRHKKTPGENWNWGMKKHSQRETFITTIIDYVTNVKF